MERTSIGQDDSRAGAGKETFYQEGMEEEKGKKAERARYPVNPVTGGAETGLYTKREARVISRGA